MFYISNLKTVAGIYSRQHYHYPLALLVRAFYSAQTKITLFAEGIRKSVKNVIDIKLTTEDMCMRNLFTSEGNIGQEPVLKKQPIDGDIRHVLELNVKFNFDRLNKSTGEYEDRGGFWAKVTLWGKRAETIFPLLKTGMRVLVVGEISQHNYVAESGERAGQLITATDINANHLALVLTKSIKEIQYVRGNADDQEEHIEE